MPTYEYACRSCDQHIEVAESFSDDPLTQCPHCGGPLRKVFGNIGIVLKGSGFYKNDSRAAAGSGNGSKDGPRTGSDGAPGGSPADGGDGGPAQPAKADGAGDTTASGAAAGSSASGDGSSAGSTGGTADAKKEKKEKVARPAV